MLERLALMTVGPCPDHARSTISVSSRRQSCQTVGIQCVVDARGGIRGVSLAGRVRYEDEEEEEGCKARMVADFVNGGAGYVDSKTGFGVGDFAVDGDSRVCDLRIHRLSFDDALAERN